MDPASWKDIATCRGINYHYYVASAEDNSLPTLLFLHDFPSTSVIWRHQVVFFQQEGFGLIVPDLLGFGGTAKPTDPEIYKPRLVCQDIIDILEAEKVTNVIVIGHGGLGSKLASIFANLHACRFLAFAFFAVPYTAPLPQFALQYTLASTKRMCGYELFGFMSFFADDEADQIIESHVDSFHSAIFPQDPKIWVTDVAPTSALQAWLEAEKKTPLPSYITKQEKQAWKDTFLKGGFAAPLCWFKALVSGVIADDEKAIPLENYLVHKPVFFGAARHDYVSRSVHGIAVTSRQCKNATIREFNADHWLILSVPAEVNKALHSWIMDIT